MQNFSLDPIRPYQNQTIKLELPGDRTIFNINWFSVYDLHTNQVMGSIYMPDMLNVPPSLTKILVGPYDHLTILKSKLHSIVVLASGGSPSKLSSTAQVLSCLMGSFRTTNHPTTDWTNRRRQLHGVRYFWLPGKESDVGGGHSSDLYHWGQSRICD